MTSDELIQFVENNYDGTYPVLYPRFASCDILGDDARLAAQFEHYLGSIEDMDSTEDDVDLRRRFGYFLEDSTAPTFAAAHKKDMDCLFPWTTSANCAFEVPYAIKNDDGSFQVFDDMNRWLAFLDENAADACRFTTFTDFTDWLGVRLLCDF